jgi:hypothetical protein
MALHGFRDTLGKLTELYSAGLIDETEFNKRRAELVDTYVGAPREAPRGVTGHGRVTIGGRGGPPPGSTAAGPSATYAPSYIPSYPTGYPPLSYRPEAPPPQWALPGPGIPVPVAITPDYGRWDPGLHCHNCGATDHLVRQCPYPESCHNCGRPDHKMGQCPFPPQRPPPHYPLQPPPPQHPPLPPLPYPQQGTGPPPRGRTLRCHNCGAVDHLVKMCPHPEVCHNCKAADHKVGDCPLPPACHVCGSTDHKVRDCPQRSAFRARLGPGPGPDPGPGLGAAAAGAPR